MWSRGFGHVTASEVARVLDTLQALKPTTSLRVDDARLLALVDAFEGRPVVPAPAGLSDVLKEQGL